jgi:hypothetical protein
MISLFVVLPKWAVETLALWILHTYAFKLRDISTYIGLESPEHRCGKTTLVTVLTKLASRCLTSNNISAPALFRAIQEYQPTLIIDEADTFLPGNEELRGILNAGYRRDTAYVVRIAQVTPAPNDETPNPSSAMGLVSFSCWCPKLISRIGRLPTTLADRCIIIRMDRKTPNEVCERLRKLDGRKLQEQCARFVLDHRAAIAQAEPLLPESLHDRAADIWEPLLALADLAGGDWPELARQAAVGLSASAQDNNPMGSLLMDIFALFINSGKDRLPTRDLVAGLNTYFSDRPWMDLRKGKEATEIWLSKQLRPYGISPRTHRFDGRLAKGYEQADFQEAFRRYIPNSEVDALRAAWEKPADDSSSDKAA